MYAICVDGDRHALVGWNQDTDYYDVVGVNCIVDNGDGDFIEDNFGEEVWIYTGDTIDQIQSDMLDAQGEFDFPLNIVELEQRGNAWYPIQIVE